MSWVLILSILGNNVAETPAFRRVLLHSLERLMVKVNLPIRLVLRMLNVKLSVSSSKLDQLVGPDIALAIACSRALVCENRQFALQRLELLLKLLKRRCDFIVGRFCVRHH